MQPRFALRARGASKCQGYAWGVIYLGLTQQKRKALFPGCGRPGDQVGVGGLGWYGGLNP